MKQRWKAQESHEVKINFGLCVVVVSCAYFKEAKLKFNDNLFDGDISTESIRSEGGCRLWRLGKDLSLCFAIEMGR